MRTGGKNAAPGQRDTPGKVYMTKTENAGKMGLAGIKKRKKDEKKLKMELKKACNYREDAL